LADILGKCHYFSILTPLENESYCTGPQVTAGVQTIKKLYLL